MLHARKDYNEGKMDTIPEDEPVMLLRAQDKTAAATARHWASLQPDGSELAKLVLVHADLSDAWPIKKTAYFRPAKMLV